MRAVLLLLVGLLAACDDMTDQPKNKPHDAPSAVPPAGTVSTAPAETPPPLTAELMARGRDQYRAFCAPCHAESGNGRGMVVQRGFPAPPSFQGETLSPQQLYAIIGDGSGRMYGFAARIAPSDRWAVAAYVKALQLAEGGPP